MISAEQVLQVFLADPCAEDIVCLHKVKSTSNYHYYYAANVLGVRCTLFIRTWSRYDTQDVFISLGTELYDYVQLTRSSHCLLHALVELPSERVSVLTPLDHTALFQKVLGG